MNFMFLKDTGLCQNHVLFQGPHSWPRVTNVVNVQGKSIYSLAPLLRLLVRFPVRASPTGGCWSAQSFREVTTRLTTSDLVLPLLWWELRKSAGADLWSLTCWPCKLIPLVFVSSSLMGDLLARRLHRSCGKNPLFWHLTFPLQEVLLWPSWVRCKGGTRCRAPLRPPTAPCHGAQPLPWPGELRSRTPPWSKARALWPDVTRRRPKASKRWKAVSWSRRHRTG